MKWIALLVLAAVNCSAQTAKVIALDDKESSEIKALYQQQKDIETKIFFAKAMILAKYAFEEYTVSGTQSYCIDGYGVTVCPEDKTKAPQKAVKSTRAKSGWEYGFEFSDDFKFIVPKKYDPPKTTPCGMWSANGYASTCAITTAN